MRRMMAPTMTLDTISKIRMVLTVWLMVMRIARGTVFSGQMSFERFWEVYEWDNLCTWRAMTLSLLKYSSTKLPQASSRLLPTCPKLSSTTPMLVSKNSTTFLVIFWTTALHCSSLSDIWTATDLISDPDGFPKQLKNWFPQKSSNISSSCFPFRIQIFQKTNN